MSDASNIMRDFFGVSPAEDKLYYHMRMWRDAADYAERLWELSEPYLDDERPEAASRALEAVVWEMYLAASFLDRGHDVRSRDQRRKGNGGPDLQIGDVSAWVEAVIATPGVGPDAVPPLDTDPDSPMRNVPDRELLLRITNAIDEKWRKYLKYRETGLVREDEPFVIAVNGSELPTGFIESAPPRIARAVFGIGPLVVSFDRETLKAIEEHYAPMAEVEKISGSTVPTTHFRDDRYRGISAVMWGTTSVWKRPDFFGRDLVVVHNPFAANPLPHGWFEEGTEYWAENGVQELHWKHHRRGQTAETT